MDKPNIIVILSDQLRAQDVGVYGNSTIRTPNIDRLASTGAAFEHAVSNTPVCVPARSSLLSGQYSRTCTGSLANAAPWWPLNHNRVRLLDPTLPEMLRYSGYETAVIGKWHVDPAPHLVGFNYSLVPTVLGSFASFSENAGPPHRAYLFAQDYELRKLREYLGSRSSTRPFFLYYNINSPHMPLMNVPLKYQRMYDRKEVVLRDNVWLDGELPYDRLWFHTYLWEHLYVAGEYEPVLDKLPDGFDLRDLTALYWGSVSWVDDIVGAVVETLEEQGLRDDTLVVFASDHGDNLGSHHVWNKDRFWEESVRIPLVFNWPGEIRPQMIRTQQAQIIDLMPTLLDVCGIAAPKHVQGRSLVSVLAGKAERLENPYAFIETVLGETAVRTVRHKYAVRRSPKEFGGIPDWLASVYDEKDTFLFDLVNDPYEQDNLAGDPEHEEIQSELHEALVSWDDSTPWLDAGNREAKPHERTGEKGLFPRE